jgi:hypothetical protein
VDVTDTLDARFDWDTLEFTDVGFGNTLIAVPFGSRHFRTTVPVRFNDRDFEVDVELDFDSASGKLVARFRSSDPATGMPLDVLNGFLPPEDGTHRGQGYFSYVVRPDAGLLSGTAIRNIADIRFDYTAVIATNRVDPHDPSKGTDPAKEALVTLDAGLPTSTVQSLPALTNAVSFLVRWSGADDANGSGVATYDVYVSDNGGPFTRWQAGTAATSATYSAQNGHTYTFYSVATDNVGQRQPTPAAAQATTTINVGPPLVQAAVVNGGAAQRSMVTSLTVAFNAVMTIDPGAFTLRLISGAAIGLSQTVTLLDGRTVVTLTFSGAGIVAGSLADGLYTLTVDATKVRDGQGNALDGDSNGTAGGDYVLNLHRRYGDVNGDRFVNGADFAPFRTAFGTGPGDPNYNAAFDFTGDGFDNGADFNAFRTRFGSSI